MKHTSLLFALASLLLTPSTFAGQGWYVDITNSSRTDADVYSVSESCWYFKDFTSPDAVKIEPGQTKRLYTEEKNSVNCFSRDKKFAFQVNGVAYWLEAHQTKHAVIPPFTWPYFERSINSAITYTGTVPPWGGKDNKEKIPENERGNFDTLAPNVFMNATPKPLVKIEVKSDWTQSLLGCVYTETHLPVVGDGNYTNCY